jgi:hypothetical protein
MDISEDGPLCGDGGRLRHTDSPPRRSTDARSQHDDPQVHVQACIQGRGASQEGSSPKAGPQEDRDREDDLEANSRQGLGPEDNDQAFGQHLRPRTGRCPADRITGTRGSAGAGPEQNIAARLAGALR